ncbi:MAG: GNAT family N-acetyltransferase [Candidatus Omnitrophica bacterium]|nr:GNAT family N-acetyltransferase [Candidatus Omnitrophota bacterium]
MLLATDPVFIIRKYDARDRSMVRQICCQTALMGEPSVIFFDDDEIFADALTLYFTDYESGSCFVAEYENRVVGYLLGSNNMKRMDQMTVKKIVLPLLIKALRRGTLLHKKNMAFLFHIFLSLVKGEFKAPIFLIDYPATLHINIIQEYRALGVGSKLIRAYLDYLKEEGAKGVHFATMSEKACPFFKKNSFQLLFQGHRSYFRYFLGKDILLSIYGMRIPSG